MADKRTYKFKAEVSRVLSLVVNSLYSNKEIFARELVSNASDAIDKLVFRSLEDKSLLGEKKPSIRIVPDEGAGTLALHDDGIGMTRDELIKNLGTIAHSGTQTFLEQMEAGKGDDVSLIGQFGVGFYSAFLVADIVAVTSRAAGSDEAYCWTSDADGGFTVESAERESHGTTVLLHLKEDQKQFAQSWKVRGLITRYSDFVNHPIEMPKAPPMPGDDETPSTEIEWEEVNSGAALWQRPKAEITPQQYDDFYEHLTSDHQGVRAYNHFRIEGNLLFTGLLYVPQKPPLDLMTGDSKRGVRLYVKRVFIMDECEDMVPTWLRFVRGVVDSDDLPLNVSREILQDSSVVRTIQKQVVKKTLDMLETMATDRPGSYVEFWNEFGGVLKEGLHYDPKFKDRLSQLARYRSTHGTEWVSLQDYVDRMPEGQESIYYLMGESLDAVQHSPHLEGLKNKGYEVLFMTDPVDEWAIHGLGEFGEKKLMSAAHSDLDLGDSDEEKSAKAEAAEGFKPLVEFIQGVLEDRVGEVRVSTRLTDSAVVLVIPTGGLNAWMEKLLEAQGADVPAKKRILELNPGHALIERLGKLYEKDADSTDLNEWVEVLYGQALLAEGSPLEQPHEFTGRLTRLLEKAAFAALMA